MMDRSQQHIETYYASKFAHFKGIATIKGATCKIWPEYEAPEIKRAANHQSNRQLLQLSLAEVNLLKVQLLINTDTEICVVEAVLTVLTFE